MWTRGVLGSRGEGRRRGSNRARLVITQHALLHRLARCLHQPRSKVDARPRERVLATNLRALRDGTSVRVRVSVSVRVSVRVRVRVSVSVRVRVRISVCSSRSVMCPRLGS